MKFLLALLALTIAVPALAGGNNDGECDHPVFVEIGCAAGADGRDGTDGTDGQDGKDGKDGVDGRDGVDGLNGRDGIDGRDGRDGVVDELYKSSVARQIAVAAVMEAPLPTKHGSRLSMSTAHVAGQNAFGIGYSYLADGDSREAVSFAVGFNNGEAAWRASFGFEF